DRISRAWLSSTKRFEPRQKFTPIAPAPYFTACSASVGRVTPQIFTRNFMQLPATSAAPHLGPRPASDFRPPRSHRPPRSASDVRPPHSGCQTLPQPPDRGE